MTHIIRNDVARTHAQVREALLHRGESVIAFARRHGLSNRTVCAVLSGQNKGLRGDAHKAAVALGLKVGVAEINVPANGDANMGQAA